jgi:diadenosine tetraphosphate (Ap4A) HIT family hydrolase
MENNCAFCDRNQFEERIIAETDEHYCIATLGQITGGYVLVAPKEHISCIAALPGHEMGSMVTTLQEAYTALASEYKHKNSASIRFCPVTIFEHGIVGQTVKHAHLHLLPAVIDLTPKIRTDFPKAEIQELYYTTHLGRDGYVSVELANTYEHLYQLYKKRQEPYLFWTTATGRPMVCWNPPAPLQYLRIIAAESVGHPERANWRTMDQELDRRLWSGTVRRLRPYFV